MGVGISSGNAKKFESSEASPPWDAGRVWLTPRNTPSPTCDSTPKLVALGQTVCRIPEIWVALGPALRMGHMADP